MTWTIDSPIQYIVVAYRNVVAFGRPLVSVQGDEHQPKYGALCCAVCNFGVLRGYAIYYSIQFPFRKTRIEVAFVLLITHKNKVYCKKIKRLQRFALQDESNRRIRSQCN